MVVDVSGFHDLETLKRFKGDEDMAAAASGEPENPLTLRFWEERFSLAHFIDSTLFVRFFDGTGVQHHFVFYDQALDQMVIVKRLEDGTHDEIERIDVCPGQDPLICEIDPLASFTNLMDRFGGCDSLLIH
jgi:hypothetical protein